MQYAVYTLYMNHYNDFVMFQNQKYLFCEKRTLHSTKAMIQIPVQVFSSSVMCESAINMRNSTVGQNTAFSLFYFGHIFNLACMFSDQSLIRHIFLLARCIVHVTFSTLQFEESRLPWKTKGKVFLIQFFLPPLKSILHSRSVFILHNTVLTA